MEINDYEVSRQLYYEVEQWTDDKWYEMQDKDKEWIKEQEDKLDELTNIGRNKAHG